MLGARAGVVVDVVPVVVVVDVESVVVDVDVVPVDVDVVSVDVGVVVDVVSVDDETVVVAVEVVSVDDATVVVSVEADVVPLSLTLPKAPAARNPMTKSARTAAAVQDFFCGPPFFARGAIALPFLYALSEPTELPQGRLASAVTH
jgi:hypothetical protein